MMDIWTKAIKFERMATEKPLSAKEVIEAQKEARVACEKAHMLLEKFQKASKK